MKIWIWLSIVLGARAAPSMGGTNANDLSASQQNSKPDEKPNICYNQGCNHTSSILLANMNLSVNPCDDFYRFTCGRFLETNHLADDQGELSEYSAIEDHVKVQLREILQAPIQNSDIKPFRIAKRLYSVCMNVSQREQQGLDQIKSLLKTLGGWPVLEGSSWNESAFSWENTTYEFRRLGFPIYSLLKTYVYKVRKDQYMIHVDQPETLVEKSYMKEGLANPVVKAYLEYMVDIAVMMGASRETAQQELTASLQFESRLRNITKSNEEYRKMSKLSNLVTISHLEHKYPSIPWRNHIGRIIGPVKPDEVVNLEAPDFFRSFEPLLKATPKRVLANYLLWQVMSFSSTYLTEEMNNRYFKFSSTLRGVTARKPRWQECVDETKDLDIAVGALYIRKYFNQDAKANVETMVRLILDETYKYLSTVDWMDPNTRLAAQDKVKAIIPYVAYPQELLDDSKLEQYYATMDANISSYLDFARAVSKHKRDFESTLLRQPVSETDWAVQGGASTVNAFYSPVENSIAFPAGVLQGTSFSNDRPSYMNFGSMGWTIGHEITHGFDSTGSRFDKNGTEFNWWDPSTREKYKVKSKCMVDQYGKYVVREVNGTVNGVNTLDENIADNGGLRLAYKAYLTWAASRPEEPRLPGLQRFSPRQMFWVSAATSYCGLQRAEDLKDNLLNDEHTPPEWRAVGSLANSVEFGRDFGCPLGSRMNPKEKCEVL
ncbi:hypothetical protein M8J77_007105 [Diaphorina citri]|nr:hypothetical protein M8J77_007105 [Diaphorina citri]